MFVYLLVYPVSEKNPNEERVDQQGVTKPKEEVSMSREHFGDLHEHRQKTREENLTSREEITEIHEKLKTFGEEMETMRLQGQVQEKDKDKERLQQKVAELQEKLIINENEMRPMREQLADLRGQLEDKERLKQQVAELQEKLSVKEREMRMVREQLRGQSETLEKELKEELQQTTPRDWTIKRNEIEFTDHELKQGVRGTVFRGRFCDFDVAVKEMYCQISSPHERKWFERIANIVSECHHPCLLQVFGVTTDEERPLIVTEIMNCSLRERLYDKGDSPLSTQAVSIISLDVARALNYLHQKPRPIIHHDICSASVLLRRHDNQWRAKVADYETANFVRQYTRNDIKTAMYSAPESLNEAPDLPISCMVSMYAVRKQMYYFRSSNQGETGWDKFVFTMFTHTHDRKTVPMRKKSPFPDLYPLYNVDPCMGEGVGK